MIKLTYFGLALAAELVLGASAQAQTSATGANPPAAGAQGGQLEQITVTGYVVPRVGEGPQPVVTLDRDFIDRQGDQTVSDVLLRLTQIARASRRW